MVDNTSIPCDAPCPKGTCFAMATGGGRRNCMWHVGMVPSLPWGRGWGEKLGGGVGGISSLAKIWAEKLRDSVGPPVWDKETQLALWALCSPGLRVSVPGLLQLFTSRIITQERNNSYPLGGAKKKKKDQFVTRYIIQPKMSCQNKHTHTQKYCEQKKYKKMTRLGVLMGCRHCLKHVSVPGKTKPKNV